MLFLFHWKSGHNDYYHHYFHFYCYCYWKFKQTIKSLVIWNMTKCVSIQKRRRMDNTLGLCSGWANKTIFRWSVALVWFSSCTLFLTLSVTFLLCSDKLGAISRHWILSLVRTVGYKFKWPRREGEKKYHCPDPIEQNFVFT